MLRKYITYAKLNIFPRLHDADTNKLQYVYAELRSKSAVSAALHFIFFSFFIAEVTLFRLGLQRYCGGVPFDFK